MRIALYPNEAVGGIQRVLSALHSYLPESFDRLGLPFELVQDWTEADIIHAHINFPYIDKAQKKGKKIVVSCHGMYWTGDEEWYKEADAVNRRIAESICRADAVTVPSQWIHQVIARQFNINAHIIPHGVDSTILSTPAAPKPNTITWAKYLNTPATTPLDAAELAQRLPGMQFLMTMKGRSSGNIKYVGDMPYEEYLKLLSASWLYLTTCRETFGIGILEAMAFGIPVVGWAHGNAVNLVGEDMGMLVEPGNFDQLIEAISLCNETRNALGQTAKEYVAEHYRWPDKVDMYARVYAQVAEEPAYDYDVSVVIPALNAENTIKRAVESCKVSELNVEVIVVDDGSKDKTVKIASEAGAKVLKMSKNRGQGFCRNVGFRNASGRYIFFLDADDSISTGALKTAYKELVSSPEVDFVFGKLSVNNVFSDWPPLWSDLADQLRGKNQVPYCSLQRRRVWHRAGGFRWYLPPVEDADYYTRAMSFGCVPKHLNISFLRYALGHAVTSSRIDVQKDFLAWIGWRRGDWLPAGAMRMLDKPIPVYGREPPTVSIIIPVGPEHSKYVCDALDSVLAQTFHDWEVIVVNDGDVMCKPTIEDYPFVRYAETEGKTGPAHARNIGIGMARGQFVVFLDADDYLMPSFLEMTITSYNDIDDDSCYIYTGWQNEDGKPQKAPEWSSERLLTLQPFPITTLIPRFMVDKIGGFDETLGGWEDWDFYIRLCKEGFCGVPVDYPLITYRLSSGLRRAESFEARATLVEIFKKRHPNRREIMAGCNSCGGNKRAKKVSKKSIMTTPSVEANEFVLVEYMGDSAATFTLKSKVQRGLFYRFNKNSNKTRRVHPDDAAWMTAKGFKVVEQKESPLTEPIPVQPMVRRAEVGLDDTAKLDEMFSEVIVRNLGKAGIVSIQRLIEYTKPGELEEATSVERLTKIDGIGEARAKEIMEKLKEL